MIVTDPISDMLTRIRNATMMQHGSVNIPTSKTKVEIAKILKEEGFIRSYTLDQKQDVQALIRIQLHYHPDGESAINGLKRISKPGLRVYVGKDKIPRYFGGQAIPIISTSQGILTGNRAKRQGIGGEVLCYVW
jgi:small subunit ribosomal protein S8